MIFAVYPRLRGGSDDQPIRVDYVCGLSPPTRGIRASSLAASFGFRSIPAYAGDPMSARA